MKFSYFVGAVTPTCHNNKLYLYSCMSLLCLPEEFLTPTVILKGVYKIWTGHLSGLGLEAAHP